MSTPAPVYAPPKRMLLIADLNDLQHALPFTIRCALASGAQVKILCVLRQPGSSDLSGPAFLTDVAATDDRAWEILEGATRTARKAGVECEWSIKVGSFPVALRAAIDEWNPDRIIVVPQDSYGAEQTLLDPTTEFVLHEAGVPVYVAKLSGSTPTDQKRIRILFATTLDREARFVTDYVSRTVGSYGGELTMLHVISPLPNGHPWGARVRTYAETHFQELLSGLDNQTVSYLVQEGPVVETICRVAEEGQFDLILVGYVSGASFRRDIMPGSAYGIVCGAPVPFLYSKGQTHTRIAACLLRLKGHGLRSYLRRHTRPVPARAGLSSSSNADSACYQI